MIDESKDDEDVIWWKDLPTLDDSDDDEKIEESTGVKAPKL